MRMNIENKWMRAAVPALLLHCCIGSVYCWSLMKEEIAIYIGCSNANIEWAFSLAIFFLGMSAFLLGDIVEKNIKISSLCSAICFATGMVGTGFAIETKSLWGIYLCYGAIMGTGLGLGYLTPVKTLMLWFRHNKGMATGIAVAGFGLSKVIASPIILYLMERVGLATMFYILGGISLVAMMLGHWLIKKPGDWVEPPRETPFRRIVLFKNPVFVSIWFVFYINISCGLAIISQEKSILASMGVGITTIALISSLSAAFNVFGRLFFSALSDKLALRSMVFRYILLISIAICVIVSVTSSIHNQMVILVVLLILLVNACYGGGFSSLPPVLSDNFGIVNASKIHGAALSAWACAGLTGNQMSALVVEKTGSYAGVIYVTLALYVVALIISRGFVKPMEKQIL